jgi:hypothetical protein
MTWTRKIREATSRRPVRERREPYGHQAGGGHPGAYETAIHEITDQAYVQYQAYSSQLSPIARTLALTAIAVVWLFAGSGLESTSSPVATWHHLESSAWLTCALILALAALVSDLMQYAWGAWAWGTYQWALDQILGNDNFDPDDLSPRCRAGWAVARFFQLPRYMEYSLYRQWGPVIGTSWPVRRAALRQCLSRLHSDKDMAPLDAALRLPWSPAIINRVSLAFFVSKVILLLGCYGCLGLFLLD